jgi:hypothetical protein
MRQPHLGEVTIYADITEVRMETWAADCKKLLADGWVLLGVYPLTDAAPRKSRRGQENKPQDTPRYVQRMAGYVLGKKRES